MEYNLAISFLSLFRSSYILELLFCGAVALLTLFIGLLFIRSRERLYLYYFVFLLCSFLAAYITVSTYNWETGIFDFSSGTARKNRELVTLFGLFAYCLFTLSLLNVRKQDPKLYYWIVILAAITSLYGFAYWLFYPYITPYEAEFFVVSRLIILPMSLVAIIGVSYRIQSAFKVYFIIGSIFYLAGALVAVLRETITGIPLPHFYNLTGSAYFYLGILLEIICFTLALNHRVYLIHERQKAESENLKKRALYERDLAMVRVLGTQAQYNPHFIFNQFSAIKYLIQRQENNKAIRLLTTYSRFLRQVLDNGAEQEISLERELDILRQYLRLEAIRMKGDFSFSFKIDPGINLETTLLPPVILQPYIEQIIWRDFPVEDQGQKKLTLAIKSEESEIVIGIQLSSKEGNYFGNIKNIKKKNGNRITNERMKIYNRSHKNKINCFRENQMMANGKVSAILLAFFIHKSTF